MNNLRWILNVRRFLRWSSVALAASLVQGAAAREDIRLAARPTLSPDGNTLVFTWDGDLWRAPVKGGRAVPLTTHPAEDHWPCFSPDGKQVAFQSGRTGSRQVFTMPARGGTPRAVTAHTEGYTPLEWMPDGDGILTTVWRDYNGLIGRRLLQVDARGRRADRLLVDAYGDHGTVSPDGTRVLFTREGENLYRKGYRGSKASQVWMLTLETGAFAQPVSDPGGCRSPLWRPDGRGFYYVSAQSGCFNIWEHDLDSGEDTQHTFFDEDAVILPAISRDGNTIVFRNLFDFYRYHPGSGEPPQVIRLWHTVDRSRSNSIRRWYEKVWNDGEWGSLDWTDDGLEMVFTAGGNAYVMDIVLREPRLVAGGPGLHALEAVFTPDRERILLLMDAGDRVFIQRAVRADPDAYWWQNHDFVLETLNDETTSKVNLTVSPDGNHIAYVENARDLMLADANGADPRLLLHALEMPYYEWSPDSRWMVASRKDDFDNWDVWIHAVDGSTPPYNVSRHPDYDGAATWSPDGRKLAFIGEREIRKELDLFYVYLRQEDEDKLARDRSWEEALERMRRERGDDKSEPEPSEDQEKEEEKEPETPSPDPEAPDEAEAPPADGEPEAPAEQAESESEPEAQTADESLVQIDFEGLADRVRRISISGSRESAPFWSHDSKALAFSSTIAGRKGTYKVVIPDALKPEFMNARTGSGARWITKGSKILWLSDGVPTAYTEQYPFKVYQETDLAAYRRLGFRQIWRRLKDSFYDEGFNGLDWDAQLTKYEDMAASAPTSAAFSRVVAMLQGELNASHTGFKSSDSLWKPWKAPDNWTVKTAHLGVRFAAPDGEPGWLVHDVLCDGPADRDQSRLEPGDRLLALDGRSLPADAPRATFLNGLMDRMIRLQVRAPEGTEREVLIRPIDYDRARVLVREQWIEASRDRVEERGGGGLAYVHINKMNWDTFYRFEREIFAIGYGKEGMIIDVRNNEGGFTADHLLTILCRPRSAVTIPRGGQPSYPRGYLSHLSWDKPVVVLCNQYTGSNGEIFSHAIKELGRGKLVGVPTQGAVISTPNTRILELGTLNLPRRAWFVASTGQDMEGNGAAPDTILWPTPGDLPAGRDPQLDAATDLLAQEVAAENARELPALTYARERGGE